MPSDSGVDAWRRGSLPRSRLENICPVKITGHYSSSPALKLSGIAQRSPRLAKTEERVEFAKEELPSNEIHYIEEQPSILLIKIILTHYKDKIKLLS